MDELHAWRIGEEIADTRLREHVARMRGILLDLAPQSVHVHLQQMALADVLFAPDMFEEQVLCDDPTSVLGKVGQEPVLDGRHVYLATRLDDAMLREIYREVANGDS